MRTSVIGTITEMKSQLYFIQLGYIVSVPITQERYDFILDTGKQLYKIQVKTSFEVDGGFQFPTCSSHVIKGKVTHTHYKDDDIDFFCTEFNENYYLIPVSECGQTAKRLRLEPTKNNQRQGISFAKDYIATEILDKHTRKA